MKTLEKRVPTTSVDCDAICDPKLCQIETFKSFCLLICTEKKSKIQACKASATLPLKFEKGKLQMVQDDVLVQAEQIMKKFCQQKCTAEACQTAPDLGKKCKESCHPSVISDCLKALKHTKQAD